MPRQMGNLPPPPPDWIYQERPPCSTNTPREQIRAANPHEPFPEIRYAPGTTTGSRFIMQALKDAELLTPPELKELMDGAGKAGAERAKLWLKPAKDCERAQPTGSYADPYAAVRQETYAAVRQEMLRQAQVAQMMPSLSPVPILATAYANWQYQALRNSSGINPYPAT